MTTAIARLLRSSTEDISSDAMLGMICAAAMDLLDLDGAGVMITEGDHNRYVYAASDAARGLEKVQETMRFGPCQDAAQSGRPVLAAGAEDLAAWPQFADVAASFDITAAAALPLMSRGRCWGVLDLYTSQSDPWDERTLEVAQMLADGMTAHLVVTADRHQARLSQLQLTHLSTHDALTGLPNRVLLFDRLRAELDLAGCSRGEVAVLFVDLVDFRHVNDVHGHQCGDHVLREIAQRLTVLSGPGETVAHLGGDVFVVVGSTRADGDEAEREARELAGRILEQVEAPIELEATTVMVTARIGVAVSGGGPSPQELVDEADQALFDATERQHVVGLRRLPAAAASFHGVLDTRLPRALDDDALTVHYQAVVEAAPSHRTVSAEALMRWTSSDGTVVPAEAFIEIATRNGLMPSFGAWLINDVCRQVRAWDDELGDSSPACIYLNLSARELNDPTLPATLQAALTRHQLTADRVGLEIVEEALVHRGLVYRVKELKDRGHSIAVDDFGTGHSSLARLTQLDVDVIKLDRSLTALLARDRRHVDFIGAVVALGRTVGAQVVAEGVETLDQRDALIEAGVDRLQGYLFARPDTAQALAERVTDARPAVLVRHLLSGQMAIVTPSRLGHTLQGWFGGTGTDLVQAVQQIQEDLDERRSTRKLQKYLGIEICSIHQAGRA